MKRKESLSDPKQGVIQKDPDSRPSKSECSCLDSPARDFYKLNLTFETFNLISIIIYFADFARSMQSIGQIT